MADWTPAKFYRPVLSELEKMVHDWIPGGETLRSYDNHKSRSCKTLKLFVVVSLVVTSILGAS